MAEGDYKIPSRSGYRDRMQQSEQQGGNPLVNEEELASKALHIQSKRFYLDVKQNQRGRFLKIAEVSSGGRKTRILMSMNVARELREHLQTFDEYIRTLGEQMMNADQLRSAVISRDDRKYYLDLKENERGRFLRISMVGIHTPRTQIAIPAQGVGELCTTLASLVEEFGNDDDDDHDSIESLPAIQPAQLPESKYLHVGNKNFYFDCGSNDRGIFLRIAEVRPNFRTAITIPEKVWSHFRDNINEFILTMNNERRSSLNTGEDSPSGTDKETQ
ncbi:unnamed protein product [Rotaria socialis]|uniref:Transcriptional activator protein Pur-alpha n=1 Tax=Rotaria socialis TaxID=392032 RepID=A0A817QT06_9BILA|nr:unnamed protein product [Rotaria socialis]CAF3269600.1 unnamed protein product [Rotaria socialis]CAF3534414.1 unnamed protein product [Rotaria socialis]CAF4178095.1 unnamed protein product [Rotaria socialis]